MRFLLILCILISGSAISQNDIIAKEYFKNGEYEKALIEYKKLYSNATSNINYINQIISTHQELEQYDEAESFLQNLLERINYPAFIVELGYNYQLKNDLVNAQVYYKKALESIDTKPSNVFSVARSFQNHSLLDEAIIAYENAMVLNPDFNFNLQLAQIYGEQGNIERMFNSYINFVEVNPATVRDIKRSINDFITEQSTSGNNILFRKILLKKIQEQPNLLWNDLLSWLFVQQKDFNKAFTQEKAIFNRNQQSLSRIEDLALITLNENENETAKEILTYLTENAQDSDTKLEAHNNLLQLFGFLHERNKRCNIFFRKHFNFTNQRIRKG